MSAGSVGASGSGRIEISSEPVKDDNYLCHIRVTMGGRNGLSLGATFEVDQAPDIVAQFRRAADTIETWNGGRRAASSAEDECAAVVRRNTVDGKLYRCGSWANDAVNGSIEECSALLGRPCDHPEQHHPFMAEPAVLVPA